MKDLGKNVIEIKLVGPDMIEITRTMGSTGDYTTLQHVYHEQDFSKETIQECLGHFLDVWERKMFKPRLENEKGEGYGEIGKLTNLVDIDGKLLSVGDQVLVYDVNNKFRDVSVVCENLKYRDSTEGPKYEIMGYFGLKWEKGFNYKEFFIIKLSSFEKAEHNNVCHTLKYVLKPEK